MTTKYFATLTNQGAARLANATALGLKLNITQMGVGDANGTLPTPSPTQTALINQRRIAAINSLSVDDNDAGQIIVEQVIPENEGGFWIREIGLYDDTGVLIAVANCPETYKPLLTEGSGRTQTIRMILVVSSSASITLKVDPSVVLATRKYVDDGVIEVKNYVDELVEAHEAKANPHEQYLLIKNALKEIADAGLVGEVLANLGLRDSHGYMGRLINVQVITASAMYVKTPGAKRGRVIITGAGASGSKAGVFTFSGGAGGTRIAFIELPDTVQVTIGAGGAAISSSGTGNAGGDSSFGTLMTAEGGKPNGMGGSSSGEGFGIDGGNGNSGDMQSSNTFGGASYWGGAGSGFSAGNLASLNARAPGSGGAGISTTASTSGFGAKGICVVEEFA